MLRRRVSQVTAVAAVRGVTTKGQFNPIHDFGPSFGKYSTSGSSSSSKDAAAAAPVTYAKTEKEFETIITNPGPLRVGYSPDYLNWLHLAYRNKAAYEVAKQQREKHNEKGKDASGGDHSSHSGDGLPDGDLGRFKRPATSLRRRAGEAKKAALQAEISSLVRQQGLLDLVERQPQFPFVDLANARRFHYVELFKDLVLNYYTSSYFTLGGGGGSADGDNPSGEFSFAQELWDKALLYRAILEERRNAYPEKTFKGILQAVTEVNFAPSVNPLSAMVGGGGVAAAPLADRCPGQDEYIYMRYLVKKYLVENAIEGHVVLKSHRQPTAAELLFSSPPPKDDAEVFAAIAKSSNLSAPAVGGGAAAMDATAEGGADAQKAKPSPSSSSSLAGAEMVKRIVSRKPGRYPPLEALWRCEENLPLLKILVFSELNLFVSQNPFAKFPNALPFLTRPYSTTPTQTGGDGGGNSGGGGGGGAGAGGGRWGNRPNQKGDVLSLANIIAERRGSALAPLPRNVSNVVDGRGLDVRRQQQRFHREDILAFSKIAAQNGSSRAAASGGGGSGGSGDLDGGDAASSANAFFYGTFSDQSYYNPRTTRAERRDYLSRKSIAALKEMRVAEDEGIYRRTGIEEAESMQQFGRCIENRNTLPVSLPTVAHYVSIIMKDTHISYLRHAIPTTTTTADGSSSSSSAAELERLVFQLARALNNTAANYHRQPVRRVNRQKANVAAALLDAFVEREVARARQATASSSSSSLPDDRARVASGLGPYKRFENRPLDESGYFTDAKMADYTRWMEPSH